MTNRSKNVTIAFSSAICKCDQRRTKPDKRADQKRLKKKAKKRVTEVQKRKKIRHIVESRAHLRT